MSVFPGNSPSEVTGEKENEHKMGKMKLEKRIKEWWKQFAFNYIIKVGARRENKSRRMWKKSRKRRTRKWEGGQDKEKKEKKRINTDYNWKK